MAKIAYDRQLSAHCEENSKSSLMCPLILGEILPDCLQLLADILLYQQES
jgi:hypothetical protein